MGALGCVWQSEVEDMLNLRLLANRSTFPEFGVHGDGQSSQALNHVLWQPTVVSYIYIYMVITNPHLTLKDVLEDAPFTLKHSETIVL